MGTNLLDANASPFVATDPFNPQNTLSGIIYKENLRYGDLLIQKVNGKVCEQYIHVTPKFYYPGGVSSPVSVQRGGFPPNYDQIKVFDKIDGTNICLFRYYDFDGNNFVSYKTRLTPFLRESKFGNWVQMWRKMMTLYSEPFQELLDDGYYYFGFEMFGSFNKILIEYDTILDVRLLYAIDPISGRLIEPSQWTFPKPALIAEIGPDEDPDAKYAEILARYEKDFSAGKPVEGAMFYVITGYYSTAYKCKPLAVASLQAESGRGPQRIGYRDAYTTALNAMESVNDVAELLPETYNLLAEEWSSEVIDLSKDVIDSAISDARRDILFQARVLDFFQNSEFIWSIENKAVIMRYMMQFFPKSDAKRVYQVLNNYHAIL